jgi:hypothetical protein
MKKTTARIGVGSVTLAFALAGAPAVASGGHGGDHHGGDHEGTLRTIADLESPRGIDALGHGKTLVSEADGSFSLVVEHRHGEAEVIELGSVPAVPMSTAPAIAKGAHGSVYLLTGSFGGPEADPDAPVPPGGQTLYKWKWGWDEPMAVADIAAYQSTDPDPDDQEDNPTDSNPFGLAALDDGSLLVADAAGNDLLRVRVHGDHSHITTVARLKPRMVEVPEGLPEAPPEEEPLPPAGTPILAEAVATSVTVGADGYWYVGELRGFPATPGTSEIWRIRPYSEDATCDPETPYEGACKRYADGLTSIIDLAPAHHGVYALELSKMSWLQWELGVEGADIGGLFRVSKWGRRIEELVPDQLVTPGGVDTSHHRIYLVGPIFGPGALMTIDFGGGHS